MMLEGRRRPAGIGAAEELRRAHSGGIRSASISSNTPMIEDDDDDAPRRSTRGRNPLPPSSGPLFPPLPPKQARNSPKNSPKRSPVVRPTSATITTMLRTSSDSILKEDLDVSDPPSGSVASITPPPPHTVEDQPMEVNGGEASPEHKNDWETYRRNRAMRSFRQAKSVKAEEEEEEEEMTPGRTRPTKNTRALSIPIPSTVDTPVSDVSEQRSVSAGRQVRKRRGEEQLLLDDHLLPEEIRRAATVLGKRDRRSAEREDTGEEVVEKESQGKVEEEERDGGEGEEEEEGEGQEVTRSDIAEGDPLMIQCDKCNVWQHGPCVGIWADEEAPDEYFCEECRPDLHGPLKRWIRSKGRNPAAFVPPTPEDLKHFQYTSDKQFPSQSKLWAEIAARETKAKSAPRSHHRKEAPSPVESVDARRSGRRQVSNGKPVSSGKEKEKSVMVHKEKEKEQEKPKPNHTRRVSVMSPSPQRSPSPQNHPPPKRRSTMNSRDAAYEEEVKAALEASRLEMMQAESEHSPEESEKGKEKESAEVDDLDSSLPPTKAKPKHPNQYTYRPKSSSGAQPIPSPVRRVGQGGTPVPSAPPTQHEHGTRRAGAIANGLITIPTVAVDVNRLSWHLPDSLSQFSDILPTPHPVALTITTPRTLSSISRNHFAHQSYGPFTEDRDDRGELMLPNEPIGREPQGEVGFRLEPPSRVRYPPKRITTSEMRKRVRVMLDFVSRVQGEEVKRKERARLIGIDISSLPPRKKRRLVDKDERDEDEEMPSIQEDGQTSSKMLDELMRDLLAFQDTFAQTAFPSPNLASAPTFEHVHEPSKLGISMTAEEVEPSVEMVEETVDVYREGEVSMMVEE
ncbi:hypothetical protein M231_05931 [Tremella mesenterica]|uniref:Zinc finger PHD-type domain-containing protein n=1 Tax=Tremella mesenterica TaxID=5217 RepID=A0A4Q1BGS2_TREME|nr:hypothetical protein M231_05931 [Tremella mesenterica]